MGIFSRVLKAGESRSLKRLTALTNRVNALEGDVKRLSDAELLAKTGQFRQRVDRGESLDKLMPEAFAVVREAAWRVLGQRPYDVQIVGAGALHQGRVAEMKTGEGKTLVSTMPAYLNSLGGRGVHLVTVNDYLASRDAEWMGTVHRALGLQVGLIQSAMSPAERRPAYECDITYGTNNEFGFDYLRDNMSMKPENMVQRGHHYAIVDEVDSILIDEARTPLIISGRVSDSAKWYKDFARIAARLHRDLHYEVDEGKRQVLTTEAGVYQVEQFLGVENLYDHAAVDFVHYLETALRAKELYHRDQEYLLDRGQVKIVDEFTGRVLEGRRYSEGLHQAIEAKEGARILDENQTLATITLQNYFRMYDKLSGMTGTAVTEAPELAQIYNLEVVTIPTNMPVVRDDEGDQVYKTEKAKYEAVVEEVASAHEQGQPVLLGTVSIENSERLSTLLSRRGVRHQVLNAKHHAREAEIISQAGRPQAVTVATNMAGRGVDIMLGGNHEAFARLELRREGVDPEDPKYEARFRELAANHREELTGDRDRVLEAGGLLVLGTERHESRRIDNQLRGRSGRQGDPGRTRFFLSLQDDLMRRFQGERVASIMGRLKIPDDVPIEHKMVTNAVERAQRQVEAQNFEIRKNVLKYDEVMNRQRERIYEWRNEILVKEETGSLVAKWMKETIEGIVTEEFGPLAPTDWDWQSLNRELEVYYPSSLSPDDSGRRLTTETVTEMALAQAKEAYRRKVAELGPEVVAAVERSVMLSVIDNKWREQLAEMDYLRSGIGLRAMGQRDPLTEYQREAYDLFAEMVDLVKRDSVRYLFHVKVAKPKRPAVAAPQTRRPVRAKSGKVGRNAPCPCGSGKKYKRCHGGVKVG
ncbi:MAG: preprotein translocase subunit SecA [bacterium]|nr:preprotein translocase subunit SecA [Acidimicrobiia bacterium]MCY4649187.1 preprotein translocase subunit SecA [bacterium]